MSDRVLVSPEQHAAAESSGRAAASVDSARFLLIAGVAFALVGWTDVVLTWVPPEWNSLEWEVGVISSTFDAMPLGTLGFVIIVASLLWNGSARVLRWASWLALVMTIGLLVLAAVLLLDVPPALRVIPPQTRGAMVKSFAKTGVLAGVYIALYSAAWWTMWRVSRVDGSRKGAPR